MGRAGRHAHAPCVEATQAEADDAFAFLRRMLALGADVQATDRENRSAYSGKTICQHYEGSPVWELCGDLFG